MDSIFQNLSMMYQSKQVQVAFNGGNPFNSTGGSFLKLVQNGFDTQLVLNFKPLDYTLNDSPVYSSFEQVIGNLQNVKASNLSDSNFYSFVTNQNYSPFTITTLSGGSSNDNLNVIADFTLARGLGSADTINANDFNNVTLDGGDGYDELNGGLGDNLFIVNSIYDTVVGGGGVDTIQTSVSYSLENTGVDNLIFTGTAAAALTGNGRAGSIIGGAGADTLRDGGDGIVSESGATTLIGGAGNDRYEVSNSDVVIVESLTGGIDTVVSSVDYVLANAANVENLILTGDASSGYGNAGANLIVGNDGGSTLVGLQGSDTIVGGAGGDLIFGAQATEKLGTIIYSGVDLSSLITPDIDGNLAFLGAMSDGAMVAQVDDEDGTYFVKVSKNGDIDTSFGGDGSLSPFDVFGDLEVTGVDTTDASVVLLADGRFLVSGLEKDGKEAYARLTANGALDTTFGSGGYFTPESFLANGETLLAQFGNGVDGFLVAKTTATGTRFQVFNMDGKLPAGAPTGASQAFVSSDYDFSSLTTDPNVQVQGTKVVIQGFKTIGLDAEQNPIQVPVLVRLTATGALDTTGTTAFGISGILTLGSDTLTSAFDFLDADIQVRGDAIYVSDISQTVGETINQAVLRYSADGKTPVAVNFSADDEIQDLKILSDGRIVAVVGQSSDAGDSTLFKVYNYNTSTKTYASSPISSTATSDYSYEGGLLVAQGAKILVQLADSEGNPALARLNADATLDSTFGVGGFFLVPDAEEGETYDFDDLQITISDGKLLAAGIKLTTDDGESALVVRLTADGKYDTTFGVNGVLSSEPGEGGVGFRVLSNGAIVLVDGSSEGSSATLYTKDGKLDTNFGSDTLGADSLVGGAGDDTIVGGAGKATMDGGLGDDFYVVNNPATVIRESTLSGSVTLAGDNEGEDIEVPLNGIDTVATSVNYTLGGGLEDLIGMGAVGLSLAGNSGANYIEGTYGNDTIFAGAGDNVSGGGGRDRYIVQDISAVIEGNEEGLDTLLSASSYNLSNATNIANLIYTGTAGATLTGNGGAGSIIGGSGNDTLRDGGQTVAAPGMDTTDTVAGGNSASGATTLVGGAGNDRYEVSNSEVVIVEGATGGTDTVVSSVDYSLSQAANVENLVLAGDASFGQGNAGANLIVGNDNRDTLVGLQGADTIRGGTGDDLIFGGNATFSIGRLTAPAGISFDNNSAVMLKDGSFIVRGSNEEGNSVIARYSKAGVLNTSFGSGGVITLPEGVEYPCITEQADGKLRLEGSIVEQGEMSDMNWVGSYLAQYTATGQLDATFGIGGVLTAPSGGTIQGSQTATDGSIYASITDGDDISFIRYSKDGKIDNTFAGNTGKITAPAGISFDNNSAVMLKDGSFIVRGSNEEGNSVIARYSKAGVLNTSFGSGGVITLPEGVEYPCITEQADGKLRLEGSIVEQGEMSDMNWVGSYLAQYTATGQLDATFGIGGVLTAPSGGTIQGSQTATDGSIYASITDGDDISFIRYSKDGKLDMTFAGDTVGDTLIGGDGDDTLVSGVVVSSLVGGSGDDVYFINNSGTVINDTAGTDTVYTTANFDLSKFNSIENLVFANGIGGASLIGNTLANSIVGDESNDTINGGVGADTMVGGAGNDFYIVDNAGDTIVEDANEGIDTASVIATVAQLPSGYTLSAHVENLILGGNAALSGYGNDMNNRLVGNSVNNILDGAEGDNTLDGGVGRDTLRAGSGDDYFIVDNTLDVIEDGGGSDSVEARVANYALAAGLESLILGAGITSGTGNIENNILVGNSVANTLRGLDGDDTLDGGLGADSLVGGNGNDYYIIDNAGDRVTESTIDGGSAGGIDTVEARVTGYTLANGVENLVLFGTVAAGTGNSLDNFIAGNSVANTLNGEAGVDTMFGGAGNDLYIVDNGGDTIQENADEGIDTVSVTATLTQLPSGYTLASNVENLILGGSASLSGYGNELNNWMIGNSANNILDGGEGNNTLDGGVGKDTLLAGSGNDYFIIDNTQDVIVDLGGYDSVEARVANCTLAGGLESLVLGVGITSGVGNTENNILVGNSVANTLRGLEGNDTLDGGLGADYLEGGNGNDYYIVDNVGDKVIESTVSGGVAGGIDTIEARVTGYTLSGGVENLLLFGTVVAGTGNSLNNLLQGNAVANTLNGAVGADTMFGGAGNDLYFVDNAGDTVVENESEGIDTVSVTATLTQLPSGYTLASNVENLILGGSASLSGYGNELNNWMIGNSANNILDGGEGNNTLDGGVGKDTLLAGSGNDYFIIDNTQDVIVDLGGYDSVEARVANCTLAGGLESLVLGVGITSGVGNTENNILVGNSVANTLRGLEGNDTLDGGLGADYLEGGNGNDYYIVDNAGDKVIESTVSGGVAGGIDTIEARVTGYTLANGVENLVLFGTIASGTGNSLDNVLLGNSANNSLIGGAGNDTLSAAGLNLGIGQKDTLTGGNGADYFILGDLNGAFYTDGNILSTGVADYAYITDFDANADKLVLSGTESNYTIVTGAGIGVTGLTGNGYYGLFREEGTTDELIAVLKSGNTNGKAIGDFAQFL